MGEKHRVGEHGAPTMRPDEAVKAAHVAENDTAIEGRGSVPRVAAEDDDTEAQGGKVFTHDQPGLSETAKRTD